MHQTRPIAANINRMQLITVSTRAGSNAWPLTGVSSLCCLIECQHQQQPCPSTLARFNCSNPQMKEFEARSADENKEIRICTLRVTTFRFRLEYAQTHVYSSVIQATLANKILTKIHSTDHHGNSSFIIST